MGLEVFVSSSEVGSICVCEVERNGIQLIICFSHHLICSVTGRNLGQIDWRLEFKKEQIEFMMADSSKDALS